MGPCGVLTCELREREWGSGCEGSDKLTIVTQQIGGCWQQFVRRNHHLLVTVTIIVNVIKMLMVMLYALAYIMTPIAMTNS